MSALQCLLKESGEYGGALSGSYNRRTQAAAARWQAGHGFAESTTWSRRHWMGLTAAGGRPVLKLGSAGEPVRRVQRALNAATDGGGVKVTGVFNAATETALEKWQDRVRQQSNGIVVGPGRRCARAARGPDRASCRLPAEPPSAPGSGQRPQPGAAASEVKKPSPSVPEPVRSSTACSGCGIRPTTLPRSLVTPAMSRSEPLGLSSR